MHGNVRLSTTELVEPNEGLHLFCLDHVGGDYRIYLEVIFFSILLLIFWFWGGNIEQTRRESILVQQYFGRVVSYRIVSATRRNDKNIDVLSACH